MRFLREPMVFPIKMIVICFVAKNSILYFDVMELTIGSEFLEALGVVFLLLLV